MIFEGKLTLYSLENTAPKGLKPVERLKKIDDAYYGKRVVGYNRRYAALGADQKIDDLVRIWRRPVRAGNYAVLEDGLQYRIDFAQDLIDEDGLPVTDLTLSRLENHYDVAGETEDTV